jgi:oxygen-independent coproporphyrinogen-3 oxidase
MDVKGPGGEDYDNSAMETELPTPRPASAAPTFDADLIRRYDRSGPRYTSYPTADRFTDRFGASDYVDAIAERNQLRANEPLSLYVHLPFCDTVCYYCACNKVITKDHTRSARYIGYLNREIETVSGLLEGERAVTQLHWGGGTPTFLALEEMTALFEVLRRHFRFNDDAEISIEVDPRKAGADTIEHLAKLGFNRLSVGIQDFDPEVQKAVNRIQSEAETRTVIDAARANGFVSINADLIYGLPRQTLEGFAVTLDKVVAASPDRIALYSYAHVPHLVKPQRSIDVATLPTADVKLAILALAIERLRAAGYVYIGMDHFAKPGDELALAQAAGTLHRNFQGYSTRPDCDLFAFGMSAIGRIGRVYTQNVKTLDAYYERVGMGQLPVARGYRLDDDDVLRRDVIARVMCDFELRFRDIEASHDIRFAERFAGELEALAPLAADGLVELSPDRIRVTPRGRLLVRHVAMIFDRHLREAAERARYSRVI